MRRLYLGTVAVAIACGPLPPPPASVVPVNEGCPDDCADFQPPTGGGTTLPANCSPYAGNKVCLVNETLSYVLAVSVAQTDAVGPGLTVVVAPSGQTSTGPLKVPVPASVYGVYLATGQDVMNVQRNTYNTAPFTALPVQVAYFPQYASADAQSIGLPLLPIVATAAALPPGDPYASSAFNVGHTSPPMGWSAIVPDPSSGETYVQQVTVDPPFDDSFPPDISGDYAVHDDLRTYTNQDQLVLSLASATSLDGWQVYIEDSSLRRVSNLLTVHGATLKGPPLLFTSQPAPTSGWAVVVQPADPGKPTFVDHLLGSAINVTYPTLPPSVKVQGNVVPPSGQSAGATLVFQSTTLDVAGAPAIPFLNYQATATSDASSGAYSLTLPAGHYDVTITPADPTLPKLVLRGRTAQGSLDLPIPPAATVSGRCFVADLRPLALADIELVPAVGVSSGTSTPPQPWTLPRPARTTTDAHGAFSIAVDQGTYDVTVKPAAGSYLPWIVLTSYPVAGNDVTLPGCTVPAPVLESVTLEWKDPAMTPVSYAIVRAYSRHQNSPTDPTYHEIGSGITDANGHTDLFLAPLQ